ncbi:regulatory protein RecX [Kitasatospora sp. NPDC088134]|uniref:regulatory protein RecX n=1 Tax=Kitasatospora sp. NPDC088134 TaxID=3364071 RepID=UPI00380B106E
MTHRRTSEDPAPGPSEDGPGAGVWADGDEDGRHGETGPPDWFAAVAHRPPRASGTGSGERTPRRRRRTDDLPGEEQPLGDGEFPGLVRASARPAGEEPSGAGEPPAGRDDVRAQEPVGIGEVPGLVRASALAGGHRRRRSALGELPVAVPEAEPRARVRRDAEGERPARRRRGAAESDGADAPRRRGARKAEPEGDPADRARDICLRLLTGAAKSRKQLADALRRKEIPEEVAGQVLDRLEEVGLIDDAAFAEAWVESRHAVRGLSRRALAQELRTKGIGGETAERALLQVDADDESEAARALVARKLRSTAGLERDVRTRRLVGVLARRGYPEGLAFRVVREALDAEEAGEECED